MCLVGFWAKLADEAGLEPKITAMFSVIHQTSYAVSKYTYAIFTSRISQTRVYFDFHINDNT